MPDLTEWWSYGPSDFLLFSPRAYWRLFELHNEAVWPLQVPALIAGLMLILLALWRPRFHGRLIALVLAVLWAYVAWSFFWIRYATINWAAVCVAPAFALEALLLLAVGGMRDRLGFDRRSSAQRIGLALAVFAVAIYPLLGPLFGRPWSAAEAFGIAPDPTAIGTLGLLILARGRLALLLMPVPLLWTLASGATLWAMEDPEVWVALGAAALAVAAALWAVVERPRPLRSGEARP
jgi:Family of unknown function (DUF6064)